LPTHKEIFISASAHSVSSSRRRGPITIDADCYAGLWPQVA
jgi:hypothetical protein